MIKKILLLLLIILLIFGFYSFKFAKNYPKDINLKHKEDYFGVTFSKKFAEELELDWKELYTAILDDLEVKYIRIPIYWDDIEKNKDEYDFADYDYIFDEGAKRDVKFIATIGWRLPRWPECHAPAWLSESEVEVTKERTLLMLEEVVNRYKDRGEIIYWQLENEPLLDFYRECPKADFDFLKKEIELVKSLDDRKIIITASGELSTWSKEVEVADIFGTTIYRVVWASWFGYSRYPVPEWFYQFKADFYDIPPENRMIMELQLEPWTPQGRIIDLKPEQYNKSMSIDQFKANAQYAINVDFKQAYTWGVEWWWWQYKFGDKSYWETAKEIF